MKYAIVLIACSFYIGPCIDTRYAVLIPRDVGPRTNKADRESITGQYRINKFISLLSNNQNSSYDWSICMASPYDKN